MTKKCVRYDTKVKKVVVIKSFLESYWYANRIGETFTVIDSYDKENFRCVKVIKGKIENEPFFLLKEDVLIKNGKEHVVFT